MPKLKSIGNNNQPRSEIIGAGITKGKEMHEKNRGYNGWSNYETWNFKLWLDNDEPTYKRTQELVKSCNNDHINLAYKLTDLAHKEAPEIQASFYSDVMMASVREVNYLEVARSLLED